MDSHNCPPAHLGAVQADDAVDIASTVIEVGDSDGMLAGGQPVLLGVGIDLEDMGPRAVDGLLPKGHEEKVVNLLRPQHQRLTETKASTKTPVGNRGVRSPRQLNDCFAITHSYATERETVKGLQPTLMVFC